MTDELGPPRWVLVWLVVVSLIVVAAAGFVAYRAQKASDLAGQTAVLERQNSTILQAIHQSELLRDAGSKKNSLAFAAILEGIAGGFATPPAPDPGRKEAVQKLCDTAKAFRAAAGDTHPPVCPAP